MTRSISYLFCISLFILLSCSSKNTNELEPGILEPAVMSKVLYDMNIAETKLLRRNESLQIQNLQRKEDLAFILEKHTIADSVFDASYAFYSTHPTWMKKVIESAIEKVDSQSVQLGK